MFRLDGADDRPRNLDYLLEDDEKPHSSLGLVIGIVVALALAGGFGWLRWRHGNIPGFARTTAPAEQATPVPAPAPVASEQNNASFSAAPPAAAAATSPSPVPAEPAAPPAAATSPAASGTSSEAAAPPGAPGNSPPASPTNVTTDASNREKMPTGPSAVPVGGVESPPERVSPGPGASSDGGAAAEVPAVASVKPTPTPKPAPAPKSDAVTLGETYLYGRGVPQSCEKGLRYIKPVAEVNPKAMITMGALYATGHCVARDLPSAYRYFALALRKDPDNAALKQNAEMVWSQMTPSERQQAIRLTQ